MTLGADSITELTFHRFCLRIDCQHSSGSSNSTNIVPKLEDVTFEGPVKEYGSKARL